MNSVGKKRPSLIECLLREAAPTGTSAPLDRVRSAGQKSPNVIYTGLRLAFSKKLASLPLNRRGWPNLAASECPSISAADHSEMRSISVGSALNYPVCVQYSAFYYLWMATKKNQPTRDWVIEGFDGTTRIFEQTLPKTSWPDVRMIVLLQRLVSGQLLGNDIVDGTRPPRDPSRKLIFQARREFVDGKISITVGENPYFVATRNGVDKRRS